MTTTAWRRHRYTYTEYLALEQSSTVRHEYFDGEIYAMAGGTPTHAALAAVVIRLVGSQMPERCRVYTSDLRIRVPHTGLTTYPDVSVVCGPTLRASDDPLAVTNPVLLVEVTSPSTEEYDRGEKLAQYQQLASVDEVLIVSHRQAELTVHRRDVSGGWTTSTARRGEQVRLVSVDALVSVDEVYRDGLEDVDPAS